jgi:hypothetical protein
MEPPWAQETLLAVGVLFGYLVFAFPRGPILLLHPAPLKKPERAVRFFRWMGALIAVCSALKLLTYVL